ncbi:MAG: hypothetical protein PHN38_07885 [Sulfurospirillaceae bacterium]|nr:hypothetical protein [Sulfurospirillaceae bacterium]MDD3462632.1 hypothetical protein [Sulfurospirillaceae bacterium]
MWKLSGLFLAFVLSATFCVAGDLDDGIGKFDADPISADDQVFQGQKNISYIKMKSKSSAGVSGKSGGTSSGGNSMNSVILGAGTNVKGDIIIIDQSKGDKTIVGK